MLQNSSFIIARGGGHPHHDPNYALDIACVIPRVPRSTYIKEIEPIWSAYLAGLIGPDQREAMLRPYRERLKHNPRSFDKPPEQ